MIGIYSSDFMKKKTKILTHFSILHCITIQRKTNTFPTLPWDGARREDFMKLVIFFKFDDAIFGRGLFVSLQEIFQKWNVLL